MTANRPPDLPPDNARTLLPAPSRDLSGHAVGAYQIISRLGSGGMGEVYLARDTKLDRFVAIKLLTPDVAADSNRLRRFEQEARAASSLNHPHILVIHDVGEFDGRAFIVTEYIEGETLRARLQRGPLKPKDALDLAIPVASALGAAHERGIVHRDIKPENVMVRPDGYVKVLDFGLAKLVVGSGLDDALTRPGLVMGTPGYMSPEQARGLDTDARSDVWSLGVLLYEMIAGTPPFEGPTHADVLSAILRSEPVPIDRRVRDVPKALSQTITRALSKTPAARFADGRELGAQLHAVKAALDASPRRTSMRTPGSGTTGTKRATIDSLAVLPFANASGDPDAEYFCDGVTESIIGSLSALPKLRVMARSTTFRYKGQDIDPMSVGRDLNVRAVLTGRVIQRGDRLMMALELVDVQEGWRLWGGQYDARLADVFDLQEKITNEVSDKLRVKLTGQERSKLAKRQTKNVAAYQAYLRGRYSWNKRVEAGFRQAIKSFQEAIDADPTYALAYSGLADCYALLGIAEYGAMPPHAVMPKAKWAAQKALEIDDQLAEAHTSLAHVLGFYDWDWDAAEREFERAIDLNPKYAFAHHWYAIFLAAMGRLDSAIASELRALELEPLSLVINKNVGTIYYYARRYEESYAQYERALALDPDFARTHIFLGFAHHTTGKLDEAIDELHKGLALSGDSVVVLSTLGYALAAGGRKAEAREVLDALATRATTQYVPSFGQALIHVGLGETDRAFDYLERAYDERSSWLVSLKVEPLLDPIRSDPRFTDLMRRVGLC